MLCGSSGRREGRSLRSPAISGSVRGNRPGAASRSARGSTMSPTAGGLAAHDGDRPTSPRGPPPAHRRVWRSWRRDGPARRRATCRCRRAWRPSGGWHAAPRATARSSLDTALRSCESKRCGAAPSRSSTANDPAVARSHYTCALGMRDRDLLTLREAQIPLRHRSQTDRRHPASLSEPPRPHRLRHPSDTGRVLARHPASDRLPEPDPVLAPRRRGPPRRPHLAPHRTNRLLTLANTHRRTPPSRGVATTG